MYLIRLLLISGFILLNNNSEAQDSIYLDSGMQAIIREDYTRALSCFEQFLDENPNSGLGYFQKGVCYMMLEKTGPAIVDFNKAILLDTNLYEVYINRALAHQSAGNYTFAETDLLLYKERFPRSKKTYLLLGNLMETMKDYNASVQYYTEYLELDATDTQVLSLRALSYSELGHTELALEDIDLCIRLAQNPNLYWLVKGYIYTQNHDNSSAVDAYNIVLLQSPQNTEALTYRAEALFALGRYNESIEDYNTLIMKKGRKSNLIFDLANCHLQLGENKEAVALFTEALALNYENTGVLLMFRGVAYHNMGMNAEACVDWKKSIESGTREATSYLKMYCND